jgi:glucokinase
MIEGAVAGVDIGGTKAKVGLVDAGGRVILKKSVSTGMEVSASALADICTAALESIQKKARLKAQAVGIGCAGIVEHEKGLIISSPNLPKLSGKNVGRLFARATGLPVTIENDANVFGFAECTRGAARNTKTAVFITLGTGVGGAIIHCGSLIRGERGFAGEVGHLPIDPSGPICTCGNRGCLESYIGASGIVERAKEALSASHRNSTLRGKRLTPKVIWDASKQRDSLARDIVRSTGYYLGLGLAGIVNILDPGVIVLGGGIGSVRNDVFLASARATMMEHVMSGKKRTVKIARATLGSDAGLIGASLLARGLR